MMPMPTCHQRSALLSDPLGTAAQDVTACHAELAAVHAHEAQLKLQLEEATRQQQQQQQQQLQHPAPADPALQNETLASERAERAPHPTRVGNGSIHGSGGCLEDEQSGAEQSMRSAIDTAARLVTTLLRIWALVATAAAGRLALRLRAQQQCLGRQKGVQGAGVAAVAKPAAAGAAGAASPGPHRAQSAPAEGGSLHTSAPSTPRIRRCTRSPAACTPSSREPSCWARRHLQPSPPAEPGRSTHASNCVDSLLRPARWASTTAAEQLRVPSFSPGALPTIPSAAGLELEAAAEMPATVSTESLQRAGPRRHEMDQSWRQTGQQQQQEGKQVAMGITAASSTELLAKEPEQHLPELLAALSQRQQATDMQLAALQAQLAAAEAQIGGRQLMSEIEARVSARQVGLLRAMLSSKERQLAALIGSGGGGSMQLPQGEQPESSLT